MPAKAVIEDGTLMAEQNRQERQWRCPVEQTTTSAWELEEVVCLVVDQEAVVTRS